MWLILCSVVAVVYDLHVLRLGGFWQAVHEFDVEILVLFFMCLTAFVSQMSHRSRHTRDS